MPISWEAAGGAMDTMEEERLRREKGEDTARASTLQMLSKNYDVEAQDLAPLERHQRRAQMFTLAKLAPQDRANLMQSSHSQALGEMQRGVLEGGAPAMAEPTEAPTMGVIEGPQGPEPTKSPIAMPSVAQGRLDELQQKIRVNPSMPLTERQENRKEQAALRLVETNRLMQEEVAQRSKKRQLADIEGMKGELPPEMYQRARVDAALGGKGAGVFSGMNPSMGAKTVSLRDPQGNVHLLEHSGRMGKFFQPGTQTEVPVTSDWEPVATAGADKLVFVNDGYGNGFSMNLSAIDRGEPRNEAVHYMGPMSPRHPTLPPGAMEAFLAGGMDIGQILGVVRSPWLQTDVLKVAGGGGAAPTGGGLSQPPGAPAVAPAGTVKAPSGRNVIPISGQLTPQASEATRKLVPALHDLKVVQQEMSKEPNSNNPLSSWSQWAQYRMGILTDRTYMADLARTAVQASSPYLGGRQAVKLQELIMMHLPEPTDSIALARVKLTKAIRALEVMNDSTIKLGQKNITAANAQSAVTGIMAELESPDTVKGGGRTVVMDPNGKPHWFDTPKAAEWFRKQIGGR